MKNLDHNIFYKLSCTNFMEMDIQNILCNLKWVTISKLMNKMENQNILRFVKLTHMESQEMSKDAPNLDR